MIENFLTLSSVLLMLLPQGRKRVPRLEFKK